MICECSASIKLSFFHLCKLPFCFYSTKFNEIFDFNVICISKVVFIQINVFFEYTDWLMLNKIFPDVTADLKYTFDIVNVNGNQCVT